MNYTETPLLIMIVLAISIGITPAFAQNQTDTDGKTIEQATITMNVVLADGKCDQLEKINATFLTKCDSSKMERQFFVITFPPENFRKMTLDTPDLKPSDGIYTDKMDVKLWKKYAEYLGKQNKLTQRGDTDFSSIQDKTVTVKVHLNENECKFVDGLGIKESDFSCKNKMVVDVPPSKFEKLSDLDFVESIKLPSADEIVEEEGITFPDNGEPSISEQSKIDSTTSNVEQATITMNAKLYNNPKCDTLEKFGAIMSPKCDSDKKDRQFIVITFPPEFFYHIYNRDNGISTAGGSHTHKMDYQLWAKYAGYLAQQNKLTQRGDTDFSSIKDEPVKVKLYLNENECQFVDGLGIKESDFSCKNEMHLYVPPSKFEKLADLDFVESIKLPYADEIWEVEGITFPDNGEPSISERNPIEPTTIESVTNDIEQATITMNAVLADGKCDQLEKLNATSLTKCDSNKMEHQFLVITFPPEFFYHMFHSETGLVPVGGSYSDKMDYQLWAKYAGYLAQQNKLIQRGDTDFSSIKDELVQVTVYLNENECKFVDGLGIKESDFSCKNEMSAYVPASKLKKLADLDFVTTVGMYLEPNWNVFEDTEPLISEQSPIEPTTIESSTNDYTPYILVLIIIPVSVVITLFWRLRKKAKIEA